MANRKITQFTALTAGTQTPTMVLPIVDPTLGNTAAANKKVTLNNLFFDLGLNTTDFGISQTGVATGSAPSASAAGKMKWYYNTTDSTFKLSRNTGLYGTVQVNNAASVTPGAGTTQTIDLSVRTMWTILLPAGNITVSTAGTQLFPTYFTTQFYQDAVGGRTITWGGTFFNNSAAMTIQPDATANSATTFNFYSDGTNCFLISWSSDAGNFAIPTSTFAALPASPGYVAEYLLTDKNKSIWAYNTNASQWISQNGGVANIQDFGANSNLSDNSTAIQAAINSGFPVFIPETSGTFKFASTLIIAASDFYMFGNGATSALEYTGTTVGIKVGDTTANYQRIKLLNFSLKIATPVTGIWFVDVYSSLMDGVKVLGACCGGEIPSSYGDKAGVRITSGAGGGDTRNSSAVSLQNCVVSNIAGSGIVYDGQTSSVNHTLINVTSEAGGKYAVESKYDGVAWAPGSLQIYGGLFEGWRLGGMYFDRGFSRLEIDGAYWEATAAPYAATIGIDLANTSTYSDTVIIRQCSFSIGAGGPSAIRVNNVFTGKIDSNLFAMAAATPAVYFVSAPTPYKTQIEFTNNFGQDYGAGVFSTAFGGTFTGITITSASNSLFETVDSPLSISIAGSSKFYLVGNGGNTGYLGLGTASPAWNLDIQGAQPTLNIQTTVSQTFFCRLLMQNENGQYTYLGKNGSNPSSFHSNGQVYASVFGSTNRTVEIGTSGLVRINITHNGLIGINKGVVTPNAQLAVLSTTEQLRLEYDVSNYSSFTVSSGGNLTIGASGGSVTVANPIFTGKQRNNTTSTGAGAALLGANSPAATLTAPFEWINAICSDGSTGYIPIWK